MHVRPIHKLHWSAHKTRWLVNEVCVVFHLSSGILIWWWWYFAFKILEIPFISSWCIHPFAFTLQKGDSPYNEGDSPFKKDESPFEGWMKARQIQFSLFQFTEKVCITNSGINTVLYKRLLLFFWFTYLKEFYKIFSSLFTFSLKEDKIWEWKIKC